MKSADLPLVLMAIVAPLGALDILYFHVWKFRLYDAPSARCETVTHLVRGSVFAVIVAALTAVRPAGVWYWIIAIPVVADFVNNLVDVWLEGASRAPLGGLPRIEYVIHIIGSTFAGAVAVAFLMISWPERLHATALLPAVHPSWLALQGYAAAIGGALITALELCLFLRSVRYRGWTTT